MQTYVIDGFSCGILENLIPNRKTHTTQCDDKLCLSKVPARCLSLEQSIGHTHTSTVAQQTQHSLSMVCRHAQFTHTSAMTSAIHLATRRGTLSGSGCASTFLWTSLSKSRRGRAHTTRVCFGRLCRHQVLPIPGGKHTGFMHLFYFFFHEGEDADTYSCVTGRCVPDASGVPLETCKAACGPVIENMMTSTWHLV